MNHRRKQCREGESCRPESDAQAWHCLIEHSAIPVKELVGKLASEYGIHVREGYLYEAANPYRQPEHSGYVQARLLVPLTEITGNFVVLDWIERRMGRVAIPLPAESPADRELFGAGADAIQQFSESLQAYTAAIADGAITA